MSKKTSIIYLSITMCLGVLNHFIYDWFNFIIIGVVAPVNESIFEHIKLVFYPFLLTIIVRFFFYFDKYYFYKAAVSSISGVIILPVIYYFFYIFFTPPAFLNILIFIFVCCLQEYIFYKLMNEESKYLLVGNAEGIIMITVLVLAFSVFTFKPPHIELFRDPVTNTYGIYNEKN